MNDMVKARLRQYNAATTHADKARHSEAIVALVRMARREKRLQTWQAFARFVLLVICLTVVFICS